MWLCSPVCVGPGRKQGRAFSHEAAHFNWQAVLVFLICAAFLFGAVVTFPNGPPNTEYICQEMFPVGHQANAQFTKPPYEILLSNNMYTPFEKIRGKALS